MGMKKTDSHNAMAMQAQSWIACSSAKSENYSKSECHWQTLPTEQECKPSKFILLNNAPALDDLNLILSRRQNLIMREIQLLNTAEAILKEIKQRLIIIKSRTNNYDTSKAVRNRPWS
ncbi:unnamed protein product [Orchesella dallaii]|uniref:Uncharacterized protein n=1 Tax=Orchesella dallaii TaxID=48710 RepID=A0ABP1QAE6_9HEXA